MSRCSILVLKREMRVFSGATFRVILVGVFDLRDEKLYSRTMSCGGGIPLMTQDRMGRESLERGWVRQPPPVRPPLRYLLLFVGNAVFENTQTMY